MVCIVFLIAILMLKKLKYNFSLKSLYCNLENLRSLPTANMEQVAIQKVYLIYRNNIYSKL